MNFMKLFTYLLPLFCLSLGLFIMAQTAQYVRVAFRAPRNGKGRSAHVA